MHISTLGRARMQFEREPIEDARCLNTAAGMWLRGYQFICGPLAIDNTRAAKLGLKSSLREISVTEEELKAELDGLVARIRASLKQNKSVERVKPMLVQSRKIKARLAVLLRKREALDNHMETLENSELNQHVLHSMQRTSNALKAMGLDKSLRDVDKVMLDLEENHSDMSSLQQTLGMSVGDEDDVDWGLELSMLLSDDCGAPPELANAMHAAAAPAVSAVPYDAARGEEHGPDAEAPPKKTELAVVEV
jgi:hypothetical protein